MNLRKKGFFPVDKIESDPSIFKYFYVYILCDCVILFLRTACERFSPPKENEISVKPHVYMTAASGYDVEGGGAINKQ